MIVFSKKEKFFFAHIITGGILGIIQILFLVMYENLDWAIFSFYSEIIWTGLFSSAIYIFSSEEKDWVFFTIVAIWGLWITDILAQFNRLYMYSLKDLSEGYVIYWDSIGHLFAGLTFFLITTNWNYKHDMRIFLKYSIPINISTAFAWEVWEEIIELLNPTLFDFNNMLLINGLLVDIPFHLLGMGIGIITYLIFYKVMENPNQKGLFYLVYLSILASVCAFLILRFDLFIPDKTS